MQDAKAALRDRMRDACAAVSPQERERASLDASQRLLALPAIRSAPTVLLYAALPDEADPGHVTATLVDAGATVLLPRVERDRLAMVRLGRDAVLQPGRFGILEPVGEAVAPTDADVVVLPGVAFDPTGARLGRGRGFYDRLLPTLRSDVVLVGFCLAAQLVEHVPVEAHDQPVHWIVTDAATHRAHAPRPPRR